MTEPEKKAPAKRSARSMVAGAKKSPGGARATATKRAQEAETKQSGPQQEPDEGEVASTTETEYGKKLRESREADEAQQGEAPKPVEMSDKIEYMTSEQYDQAYPPSVQELWMRVMNEVRSIEKGDFNKEQGFRFRGVDAVIDATGPALRKVGVMVVPHRILGTTFEEYSSKNGNRMVNRTVHVQWRVYGPQQDWFEGESMGEAADAGDKSLSKAQSVAYRVFLLQSLNVPTGQPDPDESSHERAFDPDGPVERARREWAEKHGQGQPPPTTSNEAQRPAQRQQPASQEQRQAQAGEENQAAEQDVKQARTEMWRVAKALGWEWPKLVARFKSDHDGREPLQTSVKELEAFTNQILTEAQQEEDAAKALVQSELGGREVPPDEPPFPESAPGSERLL